MKKKRSCKHPVSQICATCDTCQQCAKNRDDDLLSSRQQLDHLKRSLGESTSREEQLRQLFARGGHRPEERGERDLALARITILRSKLKTLCDPYDNGHEIVALVKTILDEDDLTRTKSIDEVMFEATSLAQQKKKQ